MKAKAKRMNERFFIREFEEEIPLHTSHKKHNPRRRPVRNWKKAWDVHATDYDEVDDFYNK